MTNNEELYISETRRFLPWGGAEPTQFWVSRTTTYEGKPCYGDPVAGPYPDIEQARAVLESLQQAAH